MALRRCRDARATVSPVRLRKKVGPVSATVLHLGKPPELGARASPVVHVVQIVHALWLSVCSSRRHLFSIVRHDVQIATKERTTVIPWVCGNRAVGCRYQLRQFAMDDAIPVLPGQPSSTSLSPDPKAREEGKGTIIRIHDYQYLLPVFSVSLRRVCSFFIQLSSWRTEIKRSTLATLDQLTFPCLSRPAKKVGPASQPVVFAAILHYCWRGMTSTAIVRFSDPDKP